MGFLRTFNKVFEDGGKCCLYDGTDPIVSSLQGLGRIISYYDETIDPYAIYKEGSHCDEAWEISTADFDSLETCY